jgi:hypothetical protein
MENRRAAFTKIDNEKTVTSIEPCTASACPIDIRVLSWLMDLTVLKTGDGVSRSPDFQEKPVAWRRQSDSVVAD